MTILPYDRQAESDVIGVMATTTTALSLGVKKLKPEDFSQAITASIFNEMRAMFSEGVPVDETTLSARLPTHHRQPLRDSVLGLGDDSRNNFDEYIGILLDRTMRRRIRQAAEEAVRATQDEVDVVSSLSVLENHAFALRDMHAGKKRKERFTMPELDEWFQEFISPDWNDDGEYCFKHALPSLQNHLGSSARGEFGVIAGYSSDGKSVYGLQMAEQASRDGHKVGYYSLEMPERQVYRRLAAMAGVPLGVIKHRTWSSDQADKLRARAIEMKAWPLDVWATSVTLEQIRADQMRYGYDMIIIDHLHRMPDSGDRIKLEKYVQSCKTLALDANCTVIALAQLSRREGFPPPTTNQLRGTDVLTQEPDWCVFIYRDRDEDGMRQMTGKAIIGKARDGDADHDFDIRLDPNQMRFIDTGQVMSLTRNDNVTVVQHPADIQMVLNGAHRG